MGWERAMGQDHQVELQGDALRLRPFRLDDAEAICAAVHESLSELLPWLPWCHPQYTIDDTREFLRGRAAAHENDGEYGFAVLERAGGRFVGACGVNQIDKANARANLGYWMRTGATRRGYATQATLIVARWAFAALELERIEIVAAVGNEASQRVAAKAGATREGIARRRLRVRDRSLDAVVFSLLRDDLAAR
jgi:RimJ/RimL family protein N-acetyltransferase